MNTRCRRIFMNQAVWVVAVLLIAGWIGSMDHGDASAQDEHSVHLPIITQPLPVGTHDTIIAG